MDDLQTIEYWARTGNEILAKVKASGKQDDVMAASCMLLQRLVNSGNTLRVLNDYAKHEWSADGASVLRTAYDAMLQALYILTAEQQDRARRFLDFGVVEQVKLIHVFDKKRTKASQRIAASSRRATVDPALEVEFQRVCAKYGYNAKDPPRNLPKHWYRGSLYDVAVKVGYDTEYELLQKQLSGIVHSSVFGIAGVSCYGDHNVMQLYWLFAFRVLDKMLGYVGTGVTETEKFLLKMSRRNIFDGHS